MYPPLLSIPSIHICLSNSFIPSTSSTACQTTLNFIFSVLCPFYHSVSLVSEFARRSVLQQCRTQLGSQVAPHGRLLRPATTILDSRLVGLRASIVKSTMELARHLRALEAGGPHISIREDMCQIGLAVAWLEGSVGLPAGHSARGTMWAHSNSIGWVSVRRMKTAGSIYRNAGGLFRFCGCGKQG